MIAGASGRMGKALLQAVQEDAALELSAALVRKGSEWAGKDISSYLSGDATGLPFTDDITAAITTCDVVIDFTQPAMTLQLAALAASHQKALVTGTTGFSDAQQQALEKAASSTPILQSFNMSVGVNLLAALVQQAAARLDDAFDIEITEMHHRHKVDAPSGTAIMLGQAAAKGRGVALDEVTSPVRDGITGPRKAGEIGFTALRGGGVVGDHDVIFAGEEEQITLSHRSHSRMIYAHGATKAAGWLATQPPRQPSGLYTMRDLLEI